QDLQDTVVFDLANANMQSSYAEFPVYFLSDDVINAVDFSLTYNTAGLAFDSIVRLANYLNVTYNEVKASDTTVYYTSYSLQTISNDTPLVMVRFSDQLCTENIISAAAYLNGNAVSVKIIDCVPNGITDAAKDKSITGIYPNPAAENAALQFSLATKSTLTFSVHDITGKTIFETQPAEYCPGSHQVNLDLSGLESGVYIVRMKSENETKSTRISVIR
ncbi:MAG TPA: T9SS type A sorting domain-containing protein, partial [Chitinophagaceae bacterium]|nr:T9SS type A sorting domain-containing protein [Chitinophagaceae bacterium]